MGFSFWQIHGLISIFCSEVLVSFAVVFWFVGFCHQEPLISVDMRNYKMKIPVDMSKPTIVTVCTCKQQMLLRKDKNTAVCGTRARSRVWRMLLWLAIRRIRIMKFEFPAKNRQRNWALFQSKMIGKDAIDEYKIR